MADQTPATSASAKKVGLEVQVPNEPFKVGLCSPMLHVAPEPLLEPLHYIEATQGKGIRDMLIDAFNVWFNVGSIELSKIKYVIRMLHNASLLIDDIEDNSKLRRGTPVAHAIYGTPTTINTANYTYFIALEEVHNMGSAEAVKVFVDELLNLHRGQGWDIIWRDSNTCPTLDQYRQMVIDKTGGLFRLATRLLQAFSKDKRDFIPLVNLLGLYYQIRDDYINLQSTTYMENKAFCEDLTEGKFSFPIIHSITTNTKDTRLMNILRRKTEDVETKKHAVQYMQSTDSFEYTKKVIEDLRGEILVELEKLGGNEHISKILSYLQTNLI